MEFDLKWIPDSSHPHYYHGLTVIAALTSHLVFKRYEPTVFGCLYGGLFTSIAVVAGLGYFANYSVLAAISMLVQCQLVYLTSLAACIILYRLSPLHPLAEYPGPVMARITSGYWAKVTSDMTPRIKLVELHQKYGDWVRIGPNQLSVLNVDAINPLYGAKGWGKGPEYCQAGVKNPDPAKASLHLLRSHELHTQRRKTWDKAFSQAAITSYQPIIYTAASRLLDALDARASQVLDLHKWTGYFTFDVMRALAFGDSGSFIEEGQDANGILHELHKATDETGLGMAIPWLLDFAVYLPLPDKAIELRKYAISKFTERRAQGQASLNVRDVFHFLLQEDVDSHKSPSDEQLANDASLVIVAGSDTTHLTLTMAVCYLISNPESYQALRKELDDALSGKTLSISDVEKLPMLNGVINECLRLQPPASQGLVRRAPPGGSMVCGKFIPEGTASRVPIYGIQRDPRAFSLASNEFRPQRWFAPERDEIVNKNAYMPFGIGPYSCIGRVVALQELRLGLASLLFKYDFKFASGFQMNQIDFGDRFLLNFKVPIPVILTKREGKQVEYPKLM